MKTRSVTKNKKMESCFNTPNDSNAPEKSGFTLVINKKGNKLSSKKLDKSNFSDSEQANSPRRGNDGGSIIMDTPKYRNTFSPLSDDEDEDENISDSDIAIDNKKGEITTNTMQGSKLRIRINRAIKRPSIRKYKKECSHLPLL